MHALQTHNPPPPHETKNQHALVKRTSQIMKNGQNQFRPPIALRTDACCVSDAWREKMWTKCANPIWEVVLMHYTRLCQLDVKMTSD